MPKAKESLQQGIDDINERQKLIKIPDRSENGWLTAQEYQTDDLAENSDDEKRIARAECQAERRRKKRGTVRGRGNYSFRGQRGRVPESFRPAYYEAVGTGYEANAQLPRGKIASTTYGRSSVGVCFSCERLGHFRRDCPLHRLGSGNTGVAAATRAPK